MEYRFNAEEWATLSAPERIRRCRLLADQAMALANSAAPDLKKAYRKIGRDWLNLAAELERNAKAP